MRFKNKQTNNDFSIDITPLLDIIFLVLIFFMIAATFDLNRSLKLELPSSLTGESTITKKKILIEVDSQNNIVLNGETTNAESLASKIREIEEYSSALVYLFGDKKASYELIISIIDILKLIGIDSISLVTSMDES